LFIRVESYNPRAYPSNCVFDRVWFHVILKDAEGNVIDDAWWDNAWKSFLDYSDSGL